jgi:hypothetical protein
MGEGVGVQTKCFCLAELAAGFVLSIVTARSRRRTDDGYGLLSQTGDCAALQLQLLRQRCPQPSRSVTLESIHDHMYYVNQQGIKSELDDLGESDDAEEFTLASNT